MPSNGVVALCPGFIAAPGTALCSVLVKISLSVLPRFANNSGLTDDDSSVFGVSYTFYPYFDEKQLNFCLNCSTTEVIFDGSQTHIFGNFESIAKTHPVFPLRFFCWFFNMLPIPLF